MLAAESALGQALCSQTDATLAREGLNRLRRAAAGGDAKALFTLGKLEFVGSLMVTQDYTLALTHLRSAAAQREPRANYYLALMAKNGYGAPPNHSEAARQLTLAAEADIPAAMFLLANAYRSGDGVPKDEARALALYQRAAERDHPESIQALAMAYQNGELGLPRDAALYQDQLQELAHAHKHAPPPP
jgi:TPR repeat protein